jgi:hypothetical protein
MNWGLIVIADDTPVKMLTGGISPPYLALYNRSPKTAALFYISSPASRLLWTSMT